MEKKAFVKFCTQQLREVFEATQQGRPDNTLKCRTEGLLLAAELLDVIDRTTASELIEQEHLSVFGETLAQRTQRKKSFQDIKDTSPDEYFDIPAIKRRK